ncbi:sugar efflux transporter [Cohnella sp. GCM10027633]|uniref:sugar efflux transporter n=1 Tax=unclassified Cohnella TaxID=2636738 RepID=UPI0036453C63
MYARLTRLFEIRGYRLLIVCMMLIGIGFSITSPYLSLYFTEELGMSTGAFGVFMAVSSISGVLVSSLLARRSDRGMDRKSLIIIAALSSSLAFASYITFQNYFVLLVAVTLFNGLGALTIPQMYAYAQESATESRSDDKTFAMSTLRSLFSLGFLIGPLGGTLILSAFGYLGLFWGTFSIYVGIAVLVFLFLRKRAPVVRTAAKGGEPLVPTPSIRQLWLPLTAFVLLFMVSFMNGINTPLFIVNELQGTHTDVGIVVSVCAGLEIPIMLALGAMGRRISNHDLMIYGCAVAFAYFGILCVSTEPWHLIAAQLLQATFIAILMGNGLSYFTNLLPGSAGMATTLYANSSTIGKLLGNLAGGFVAQFIAFRYVNGVCMAIVVLSFLLLWRSRPRQQFASA